MPSKRVPIGTYDADDRDEVSDSIKSKVSRLGALISGPYGENVFLAESTCMLVHNHMLCFTFCFDKISSIFSEMFFQFFIFI